MKLNGIRGQEKSWWGGRFKTISSISEEGMNQDNTELPRREEVCRDGSVLMLWDGRKEPGASSRGVHQEVEKTWLGLTLALPPSVLASSSEGIYGGKVFSLYSTRWLAR